MIAFNPGTADLADKVAWALCQIIDDDAPIHWTRYRSVAWCIASNKDVMDNLKALSEEKLK